MAFDKTIRWQRAKYSNMLWFWIFAVPGQVGFVQVASECYQWLWMAISLLMYGSRPAFSAMRAYAISGRSQILFVAVFVLSLVPMATNLVCAVSKLFSLWASWDWLSSKYFIASEDDFQYYSAPVNQCSEISSLSNEAFNTWVLSLYLFLNKLNCVLTMLILIVVSS